MFDCSEIGVDANSIEDFNFEWFRFRKGFTIYLQHWFTLKWFRFIKSGGGPEFNLSDIWVDVNSESDLILNDLDFIRVY